MEYKSLEKLFYMDASSDRYANNERLAEERLTADSTFRTGVMTDYGELFLATPRELSLLNERVLRLERKVSATLRTLPPVARGALIRRLVIDEVVCTNDLEGVHSTRKQINDVLKSDYTSDDPLTEKRFRELAKLYLNLSDTEAEFPKSPKGIRAIYDRVMLGESMEGIKPDGELFRKGGVEVIDARQKVLHVGLYPESAITEALTRMIAFAESDKIPETYSAIISHYIFEYAHPFYDGNGRTGRYLLALYLSRPLSILTSLSLSRVIAEHRDPYYRSFKEVETKLNHGELTFFVMNILDDVQIAQHEILDDLERRRSNLNDVRDRVVAIETSSGLSEKETDALYMLAQLELFAAFPGASLQDLSEHTGVSAQQARKYTLKLEDMGLIETTKRRPLVFNLSDVARDSLGIDV